MNGTACLLLGDVLEQLATISSESVHCVVTSPPYWGLRDYGVSGQLGLEPTPQDHIAAMVGVMREVRRVLRSDGTLWLNYGDCYAAQGGSVWPSPTNTGNKAAGGSHRRNNKPLPGLKPKDLVMMPHRLAIALQDDGWWVRSDIVWSKPNPMPESIEDRPTKSHEYLFLLAKAERYYYDATAIREKAVYTGIRGMDETGYKDAQQYNGKHGLTGGAYAPPGQAAHSNARTDKQRGHGRRHAGFNDRWDLMNKEEQASNGRNKRSVWTVATHPYPDAHFATFPPDLIRPCILAGTSEKGVCGACGTPWVRVVDRAKADRDVEAERTVQAASPGRLNGRVPGPSGRLDNTSTRGWQPSCKCGGEPVPATVLDPFFGSGTTGAVALEYGRNIIGIELNPEYLRLAEKRIAPYLAQGRLTL